jgi:hypothetical protein
MTMTNSQQRALPSIRWSVLGVLWLLLGGCGGGGGGSPGSAALTPASTTANLARSCSGAALRDKYYRLTIRDADDATLRGRDGTFERIDSGISFEEVLVDGKPYLGLAVALPADVPRNQTLQLTLTAGDERALPTCLAQIRRVIGDADTTLIVTRLYELQPSLGLRGDDGSNNFASVCEQSRPALPSLDPLDIPRVQLHASVCYAGANAGIPIAFKYDLQDHEVTWESDDAAVAAVSPTGVVSYRGPGGAVITATLLTAKGEAGIDARVSTPSAVRVSMSSVALQEGSSGIKEVQFTVQRETNSSDPLTFAYETRQGSATAGSDYCTSEDCSSAAEAHGTLQIAAEERKSPPIRLFINGDTTPELDESFTIALTAQAPGAETSTAEITLRNDDGPQAHVYAAGVGMRGQTRGDITLRTPGPDDSVFLVWNQQRTTLGNIEMSNADLGQTFALTPEYVLGGSGIARIGAHHEEACFIAQLPASMLAGTGATGINSYTLHSKDILNGAGIAVISGLVGSFPAASFAFSESLQTIATFTGGQGAEVQVKAGCDFFYHAVSGEENSQMIDFSLAAAAQERMAKVTLFVYDADPGRGSEILFTTTAGDAPVPVRLDDKPRCAGAAVTDCVQVLGSDLTPSRRALARNNGDAWDTFGQYSGAAASQSNSNATADPDLRGLVRIPAGATSASVQLISPADRDGDSATVSLAVLEIFP